MKKQITRNTIHKILNYFLLALILCLCLFGWWRSSCISNEFIRKIESLQADVSDLQIHYHKGHKREIIYE